MELSLTEMAYVGMAASFIAQAIRLYAKYRGRELSRPVIALAVLFPTSLVMAVVFRGLPDITSIDPMELAQQLTIAATQVVGVAVLFYMALGKSVFQPVSAIQARKK